MVRETEVRVILMTQKMVLGTSLLNTQQYKVRIKGKVEQSREMSSAPLHLCVVASKKGAFGSRSPTYFIYTYIYIYIQIGKNYLMIKKNV